MKDELSLTTISYLPLGDSYTIGESVAEFERWPNQLADSFERTGRSLQILENPAVTGYTTQDLITYELPLVGKLKPEFVTVLIGVNDYVQGVGIERFSANMELIVMRLRKQMHRPENILLVTIPDYAKTPAGASYGDPLVASRCILQMNDVIILAAKGAGLPCADIFEVSQLVRNDPGLVAPDGLHPSALQYRAWVRIIYAALESAHVPRPGLHIWDGN
jgi:acyl-CoA thioesterase-1